MKRFEVIWIGRQIVVRDNETGLDSAPYMTAREAGRAVAMKGASK